MRLLVVPALALVLCGCGGSTTPAPPAVSALSPSTPAPTSSSAARTLEAATAAAKEMALRSQAGDYAGVWMLFDKATRAKMSQADYVALGKACAIPGMAIEVTGVRMEGDNALVRLSAAGGLAVQSRTMVYEDGAWYELPSEAFAPHVGKPAAAMIAAMCPKKS